MFIFAALNKQKMLIMKTKYLVRFYNYRNRDFDSVTMFAESLSELIGSLECVKFAFRMAKIYSYNGNRCIKIVQ